MDISIINLLAKSRRLLLGVLTLSAFHATAQVSITCPTPITTANEAGVCGATVAFIDPVGIGVGTNITTIQTAGLPSGSFFTVGIHTIEFTVSNDEGDSDICTFDIEVEDTEDPAFDCPADITIDADPGTCETTVTFSDPTATDNCNVFSIIQIGGPPSGSVFPIGETNIDFEATDEAGNSDFCRFKIIVEDITDPIITCPSDVVLLVSAACDSAYAYIAPVGIDACTIANTVQTGGLGSGATFPIGTTTETYTVTDLAGNSAECSFDITVMDGAAPEITCPADIVVVALNDDCEIVVNFNDATAIDNCGVASIEQTAGIASGENFPVGVNTVEYTATDDAGNQSTCTFNVTVNETVNPTIICPANLTVGTDPGLCSAIVVLPIPSASDHCTDVVVTQTGGLLSGTAFPIGASTVEFTATDESGNTSSCSYDVIVEDQESPIITCPDDIFIAVEPGDCSIIVNYPSPIISDNCPGVTLNQTEGPTNGAVHQVGVKTMTFEAIDAVGNITECTFLITVTDEENPTIICPPDFTVDIPAGICTTVLNFANPIIDDNCPGVTASVISGPASGDIVSAGVHDITYQALDAAGNTADCTFQITVTESSNPTISCPNDMVIGNDAGVCEAMVIFNDPIATDSCSTVTVNQTGGPLSGSTFPLGSTAVEFTAEDEFGNTDVCSFNIIVEDQEDPTIDCPDDIIVSAPAGLCEAVVNFVAPSPADNCPGVSISQTDGPVSGSTFSAGSTQIEYTAEDAVGNTTICTFNIIVEDDEDPEITCPVDLSIAIMNGNCSGQITYPDPVFSDNCPGATFSVVSGPASGDIVSTGIYNVELQVEDASGNTANCTFELTVTESSLPVFDCPNDLQVPADPGSCEAMVTFSLPTATDSCSTVSVSQTGGPASGTVFPAGATLLEFTAEDEFGNTATCAYTITVVDDTAPEITCPDDIEVNVDLGICGAVVAYAPPTVDDNCGVQSVLLTAGIGSGNEFPVGSTTETYEVTDVSGNTATCSFTVTVIDTEVPTIDCPADIDMVLADGDCDAEVNYAAPLADDNCPGVSITLLSGLASGETFPTGSTTVTYQAEDAAGNTATCSFVVTITENVAPEIDCPNDISVSNDPDACVAIVDYTLPIGTDNCPGATTTLTAGLGSGASFPVGTTTETYTVTDASGNSISCSFDITVTDDQLPVMDCSTDITVSTDPGVCEAIVNYPAPTATDNCTAGLIPVLVLGPASGSTFPLGSTQITYEVSDAAGNTQSCSFNIIVEDQEPPVMTCPSDITVDAISGDCDAIVNYVLPFGSDNCGVVTATMITGIVPGGLFPVGTTVVTFEGEDDAGNSATCSFNVTVLEDVIPTISCPGDISVTNDAGICGAVVDFAPPVGVDNCGNATTALIAGLAPGSVFPVGTTIVTYQVTDLSGNQADCSFNIEVTDNEGPSFVCPTNQDLSADANCEFVYIFTNPVATDNCSVNIVVTQTAGPASGSTLPLGETIFTFTASDDEGNPATCTYSINVVDDTPPVFDTCPADAVVFVADDACDAVASFIEPTATDNCGVTLSQTAGPANNDVLPPGVYDYTFEAVDDAGNISLCEFSITVQDDILPEIDCEPDFETCEPAPLFSTPTATDNCAIAQVIQTAGPASGTTFPIGVSQITFEATDVNGNTSTCSFEITVLDNAPDADAGEDQNICDETSTTIEGNDPGDALGTWTLISGSGLINLPNAAATTVTNLGTGENTFAWSLDPENGCSINSDTITVYVEPGVIVDAGPDVLLENGGSAILTPTIAPAGGDILWSPALGLNCTDCENPMASPSETTLYYLTYTTALGCEKTDSVTVRVFDEFPNTITPDGDGVNDVWNIPGIENYPDVHVVIYNRWGNEVFDSTGYHEPWNGQKGGDDLPAASYFYIIDYKVSGKEVLNGTVNIIR